MEDNRKSVEVGTVFGANGLSARQAVVPANNSAENTTTGHGIMAEEALTIIDKFVGRDAEVIGRTNIKNGADRLIDGVSVQTKFYNTGKGCVSACFDSKNDGLYRYINDDGTIMPIEVPKDLYDDAVKTFASKISKGKVPGVIDSSHAEKYIKQSDLTYENSVNLCKPLTAESLLYDAATGIVHCSCALGISAVFTFILEYINSGRDMKKSICSAIKTGLKVFGITYVAHILGSQFARTKVFKSLFDLSASINSEGLVAENIQGVNNTLSLVMGGVAVSTSAAIKQFSKMVRAGLFINLITMLIFLIPDTIRLALRKIPLAEYILRVANLIMSRIFGMIALIGSSMIVTTFFIFPSIVNILICLVCSCLGGIFGRWLITRIKEILTKSNKVEV